MSGKLPRGLLPDRVAAEMRADDRQAREAPQQRDKAVRIGEVIAAVSRVQEQGQHALALLRQRKAARIVEAEALDVRMQLHAVQAQSAQVGDILLQRRRIGVQRTEAVQTVRKLRDLAGDELVDMLHLIRPCRYRLHKKFGNAVAVGEQRLHRAVERLAGVVIEGRRGLGGLAGDLCRVNVAVGVKNLHHRRSSTATR